MARSTSRPAITTAVARRRARTIASCAYGRDGSFLARSESRHNVTQSTIYQPGLECMPRERLERLTLEHMRATLARVSENPAWVKRLEGVRSEDLARVEDWRRLPFLTKEALRDAYPFGLACGREYRRIQMSSGTTGNPILNPYTAADVEQWGEVMARCYVAAGVTADDVIQITPSFGLFTGGFGFHYGAERLGAMIVPVGAGRTLLQLKLMRDLRATVLAAIATYPLRLLEVARALRPRHARAAGGDLRLRDVVGRAARPDRAGAFHPRLRHHRDDRDGRPRPWHRLRCPRRHPRLGGPLLRRDRRPRLGPCPARRRRGRAGRLGAHPGGTAAGALSHPRPHARRLARDV